MPYSDFQTAPTPIELLMDISASLADLTESLELARQIPAYLSRVIGVPSLTLAIVSDAGTPAILMQASSGELDSAEASQALQHSLLSIYQQTKPLSPLEGPTMRDQVESAAPVAVQGLSLERATVFTRALDSQHRMLLIVRQFANAFALSPDDIQVLQLVSDQLSKLLACLTAWHGQSDELGTPFDRLTDREWMVLRGLTSDQGEKQLADELRLSPHTLHSHIKSIYRKTGVQGRLLLLNKVKVAMRTLRSARLADRRRAKVGTAAAAMG